jgi:hypothetical protein
MPIPHILEVDEEPEPRPLGEAFVHITRQSTSCDRARVLCDRYGLSYDEMGARCIADVPREGVLRVEKQIRMRVRYNCHECSTTFVKGVVCAKCEHRRCRDCPRIPPKKKK